MKLLPSVVAIVVVDLMDSQRKTYHRVLTGVRNVVHQLYGHPRRVSRAFTR